MVPKYSPTAVYGIEENIHDCRVLRGEDEQELDACGPAVGEGN